MNEPHDNRARLLSAAEKLFAEKGYAATSVREILAAAGVSSPTLYYYFGSKEELIITLLRERFEEFFSRAQTELAELADVRDVLRRYTELIFEGLVDEAQTIRFVFGTLFGPRAGLPEQELHAVKATYSQILLNEVARTSPGLTPRRIVFVVTLFSGMVNGLVMGHLNGAIERVDADLAEAVASRAAIMLYDELPVPDLQLRIKWPFEGEAP